MTKKALFLRLRFFKQLVVEIVKIIKATTNNATNNFQIYLNQSL